VLDETGKPYKVIKFATDVTAIELERMRGEAERRQSDEEQGAVVSALADSLRRLAEGDLTADIQAQFEGRYQQIKDDFNSAIDSLRQAMGAIVTATGGLQAGSDEIASRLRRPVAPHRTAGRLAGGDRRRAGRADRHGRRSAAGAKEASTAASAPGKTPPAPARSCARRSPPWARSSRARARSPRSSA
jgi:methyl-accepting chemotaxis protein